MVRQRVEHDRAGVHAMTRRVGEDLARILSQTRPVLLDFDGPVCPIFANGVNSELAAKMRSTLRRAGADIPQHVADDYDPIRVLQFAATLDRPDLTALAEDVFRTGEVEAARRAIPTPGAHEAIRACHEAGRPLVIVSNNYAGAIEVYLQRHNLDPFVQAVIGRAYARPDLMKPHPDPVHRALAILEAEPASCVLVGDSVTDIEVARATGVRSIGYVKRPDRLAGLLAAGAEVTIDDMHALAQALRTVAPISSSPAA